MQYKRAQRQMIFDLESAVRRSLLSNHELHVLPPLRPDPAAPAQVGAVRATPVAGPHGGPAAKARMLRDGNLRRDLDRYSSRGGAATDGAALPAAPAQTFRERLLGRGPEEGGRATLTNVAAGTAISPYTFRRLKPFIWRDLYTEAGRRLPWKLAILREVAARGNPSPPPPAPVDYSYMRPEHLAQVNRLLCQFFWPGIDSTKVSACMG